VAILEGRRREVETGEDGGVRPAGAERETEAGTESGGERGEKIHTKGSEADRHLKREGLEGRRRCEIHGRGDEDVLQRKL